MSIFYDANLIYKAGDASIKSSNFKHSTQLFEMNHLLETAKLRRSLIQGTYYPTESHKFPISERGHIRYIASSSMVDKTIGHLLCDELLTPIIKPYLIYDNSASQKNKGVSFHRKRFETHMHQFYNRYHSNDGYILLMDFSGYYANIPHDTCSNVLYNFIEKECSDETTITISKYLIKSILHQNEVDVSRFSDDDVSRMYVDKVDPMLNYKVDKKLLTGDKTLKKGVDIGAQLSQIIGIVYPYYIDNYISIVKGCKWYGRYTDDSYVISKNKDDLVDLLDSLLELAPKYGLIINKKKTRICRLSSNFRYLQVMYSLTDTGQIIRKINPKAITRERRRLKSYHRLLINNKIEYSVIENSFKSWLGTYWKLMSHEQIYNISNLYYTLFGRKPSWKKKHGRLLWLMESPC